MHLLYGEGFATASVPLAILGLGVGGFLTAGTFSQAVLARDNGVPAAAAYAIAGVSFVAVEILLTGPPLERVSIAFTTASAIAAVLLLWTLLHTEAAARG
jgi:hypothetical protein